MRCEPDKFLIAKRRRRKSAFKSSLKGSADVSSAHRMLTEALYSLIGIYLSFICHTSDSRKETGASSFVFIVAARSLYGHGSSRARGLVGKYAHIQEERRRRPFLPCEPALRYGQIKHQITALAAHKVRTTLAMHAACFKASYKKANGRLSVAAPSSYSEII